MMSAGTTRPRRHRALSAPAVDRIEIDRPRSGRCRWFLPTSLDRRDGPPLTDCRALKNALKGSVTVTAKGVSQPGDLPAERFVPQLADNPRQAKEKL